MAPIKFLANYGITHTHTLILAKSPAENLQLKDLVFCVVTHQERKGITIYFTLVIFPTVLQYVLDEVPLQVIVMFH